MHQPLSPFEDDKKASDLHAYTPVLIVQQLFTFHSPVISKKGYLQIMDDCSSRWTKCYVVSVKFILIAVPLQSFKKLLTGWLCWKSTDLDSARFLLIQLFYTSNTKVMLLFSPMILLVVAFFALRYFLVTSNPTESRKSLCRLPICLNQCSANSLSVFFRAQNITLFLGVTAYCFS